MRTTLLSLAALLGGCTVGAFGVQHRVVSPGAAPDGEEVASEEASGEAPEAAPVRGHARGGNRVAGGPTGKLTCVHDNAGADFASATPIGKGTHLGCVDGRALGDVYAITAPADNGAGTLYRFTLAVADDQICPTMFNQDHQKLDSGCVSDGHELKFWASVAAGTSIFVKLDRNDLSPNAHPPYALTVDEQAIADADEPNNNWKHPTKLAMGEAHTAMMAATINDKHVVADFYRIKMEKAGEMQIVLDPSGSDDIEAEVAIADADHRVIESFHAENAGAILRATQHLKAGTYFVVVGPRHSLPAANLELTSTAPTSHYLAPYSIEVTAGEHAAKKRTAKR